VDCIEVHSLVFVSTPLVPTVAGVNLQRWMRIALGYLIVVSGQIGLWALVAPQSFYDDFPGLGRAWVSVDGPFNEHLVRDVGALNLAVVVVFAVAWIRLDRTIVTIAGAVALVWGFPHGVYHALNTDGLSGTDLAVSLLGLLLFAVVGGGLVWAARRNEAVAS
jgi:hypothetical protein